MTTYRDASIEDSDPEGHWQVVDPLPKYAAMNASYEVYADDYCAHKEKLGRCHRCESEDEKARARYAEFV
jgi:hypothetical protein